MLAVLMKVYCSTNPKLSLYKDFKSDAAFLLLPSCLWTIPTAEEWIKQ